MDAETLASDARTAFPKHRRPLPQQLEVEATREAVLQPTRRK